MIIKRPYEVIEANWLPDNDEVSVVLTIYPHWRTKGEADYFMKSLDCLSGYIYSAICDISEESDIEESYNRFVNRFTPVAGFGDSTAYFKVYHAFKAEDILSGKAIVDLMKYEACTDMCNPSELSLIWANSLLLLRPHIVWREEW